MWFTENGGNKIGRVSIPAAWLPAPVPTLSTWALVLLAILTLGAGALALRRYGTGS
jgi:hypothetical protein